MADNVVPFSRQPENFSEKTARQDHKANRVAADAARADAIRTAIRHRHPFSPGDQVRAARNLYDLLKNQEAKGVRKREVVERVFPKGSETDSTKRLDPYTLPEKATETRVARLAKKPGKYLNLAYALAHCARLSEDLVLCQVFEGCDFGTAEARGEDWDAERWEGLAALLADLTRHVVKVTGVEAYWRDVLRLPGRYDIVSDSFGLGRGGLYPDRLPLAGIAVHVSEVPPIPSVLIARSRMARPSPGLLSFEGGPPEEVSFDFWRETYLTIGPVRVLDRIGPLLETRIVLEAVHPQRGPITFDHPFVGSYSSPPDGIMLKYAFVYAGAVPVEIVGELEFPECPSEHPEHNYFYWEELSSYALREALTSGPYDDGSDVHPFRRDFHSYADLEAFRSWSETSPSPFLFGEEAFWLYAAIRDETFEQALIQACKDKIAKLAAHKTALGAAIREADEALRRRWAMSETPEEDAS